MANEETMLRHTLGFALAIATLACAVSCGSDSEPNSTNNNNNVTPDAGGVPCGSSSCLAVEGVTDPPCCQEQFIGKCGVMRNMRCVDPPATADPRCPSAMLPGGVGMLISCCVNGQCGITPPAGFGNGSTCTELGEAQRQANMLIGDSGFTIQFPAPQPCGS